MPLVDFSAMENALARAKDKIASYQEAANIFVASKAQQDTATASADTAKVRMDSLKEEIAAALQEADEALDAIKVNL